MSTRLPPASFGVTHYRAGEVSTDLLRLIDRISAERAARVPPPSDNRLTFIDPWVCNVYSFNVGKFLMSCLSAPSQTALPPTESSAPFSAPDLALLNIGTISRAALLIMHVRSCIDQKRDVPVEVFEALRVELQAQLDQIATQFTELNTTINENHAPAPQINNTLQIRVIKLQEEEEKPRYMPHPLKC
ncbi:hypothetical protein Hypma_002973 [Hypsizygus marmoreus]|uniref:Uncharacterized protein n=1 Tax=Hypsizygus marmoreus TaxID=39966 RepID=A0A369J9X0_HYPMA|nr:hypothetical protein Hypma_002973 [Hypsizygus marmoreus]